MRGAIVVGAALVAVGALPVAAHVVLTRFEVPAEADVDLAFRAPIEREGTTNQKIYALVPGPFVVTGCTAPSVAWQCSLDTTSRPGSTFVTWVTPVAGSPQDLRFEFRVRTPDSDDAGEFKFPVVQTYSDGHAARWIQDGEPSPAPRLVVVPKGQSVSTEEPTPPPDATRAPAPTPTRSAKATPRHAASTRAGIPTTPPGSGASRSAAPSPAATTPAPTAATAGVEITAALTAPPSNGKDESPPGARTGAAVLAALAALVGGVGVAVARGRGATPSRSAS